MTPPITEAPRTALSITFFGPMQVAVGGHALPALRSRKTLWLLALLALRHGRPVEREWLAETLWPDADPDQSLSSLRSVLSELRKALGSEGERLESPSRHTLSLHLGGAEVDLVAFDDAISANSFPALERAVSLYSGPLLEGCAEEWIGPERTAREQDCLQALRTLTEAALASGDWTGAAAYSRRAVVLDPWRDAARRDLMEALARSGDTNAALQVYREFVALLRDDPQATPDKETSDLYAKLRAEARRQADGGKPPPVAAKRGIPAPTISGYLPHSLTDLIGREDEQEEVAAQLRRSRLVTLTGPGGIGKTRLSLAVAAAVVPEYPDGVWLVALEALTDSRLVAPQVAGVLGIKETADRPLLAGLADHLRAKRLLLVLDNCEQVLEASAQLAGELLRECAGLRILATSRAALGITGETAWTVPALAVPDPAHLPAGGASLVRVLSGYEGVRLFVDRAQAAQKGFALTAENAAAVAQVCARLDGLPLALELAAARARALTVAQIAARLDDHLALLSLGSRTVPPRQQTLRATLEWSHALLSVKEQLLLGRVSVFAGGWSLEAAEAVCSGEGIASGQVLDLQTGLIDKSLLMFDARDLDTGGRYRLLEMVQQYAAERLRAGGAADAVRARHRDWFLTLAEEAERRLTGPEQGSWLRRLDGEHDNLRTALEWCKEGTQGTEAGLRLAGALWRFWELRGFYGEGQAALREVLGRPEAQARTAGRAKALNALGVLLSYQGDYAASQALHEESLTISRELGNDSGIAWSLKELGKIAGTQGDRKTAQALYEESLAISRELGDRRACAEALNDLGGLAMDRGDHAAAQARHEESLAITRALADSQASAWSLLHLGGLANERHDYGAARLIYEECLAIFREYGNKQGAAWAVSGLGKAAMHQADYAAAQTLYEESLATFRELGNIQGLAWSLDTLGVIALHESRLRSAQGQFEESLGLFRELGNKTGVAWSLLHLGDVASASGEHGTAHGLYTESLSLFQDLENREGVAAVLAAMGEQGIDAVSEDLDCDTDHIRV